MTTGPTTTTAVRARQSSALSDLVGIAQRGLRLVLRAPEEVIPALVIPVFFFVVNIGALQRLTEGMSKAMPNGLDYKAFQLPTAIIFAVTGVTRAGALVNDINDGYFDRLLMTPVRRVTLLMGLMVSDLVLVLALCVPVVVLGMIVGVSFATGPLGVLAFVALGGLWGLAFAGFPYAIALKTGSSAAVNSSFLLFFPFAFLTTSTVPRVAMTSWLGRIADFNPMTYVLEGLRSLITEGWSAAPLAKCAAAIGGVGLVSMSLAFAALRGRVNRGA